MGNKELGIRGRGEERVRIRLVILTLLSVVAVLASVAWQNSRYGRAFALEMMAQKFPPSSVQAKRFRAIAEAIRKGGKTYTFTTGRIPSLGK